MKFTEEQVEELIFESEVKTILGENRRWSRTNQTIIKFEEKYYKLYWEEGLTESQENYFESQEAKEVKEIKKKIVTTCWIEV